MSGTSLDGVDAAIVDISGSGRGVMMEQIGFLSRSYPRSLSDLLLKNSSPDTSSVFEIAQLNVRLAIEYASVVREVVEQADLLLSDIDAVGSHGQTVYHIPDAVDCAGHPVRSTLQLGDPSTLANLLNLPVVGDFRMADMAVGGQGAPLAPYFDYACFASEDETRVMLNIGGIANLTVLPAGGGPESVLAFDTGPGNMVIDAIVQHFWGEPFDRGGTRATEGTTHPEMLSALLADAYYEKPPPKSTGREVYNQAYVDRVLSAASSFKMDRPEDIVATVSTLTAESIANAIERLLQPDYRLDRVIVSGGGVHNVWLMQELNRRLHPMPVNSSFDFGLDPDAKEAQFFALLAHETLNGVSSNIPSATGASRSAILGKICIPQAGVE